jgi:hypothetical protein
LFNRGSGVTTGMVAVSTAVDEISPENDDHHGAGDSPVRAAVRSKPSVQRVFVVLNSRRVGHDRA